MYSELKLKKKLLFIYLFFEMVLDREIKNKRVLDREIKIKGC